MKRTLCLILSLLVMLSLFAGLSVASATNAPTLSDPVLQINYITAAGSGDNGFLYGIGWDPDAADNRMTEVSPKVYEITYPEVKSGKMYMVKFAANGGWDMNWGKDDDAPFSFGTAGDATYDGDNIIFTPVSTDPKTSRRPCDQSEYRQTDSVNRKKTTGRSSFLVKGEGLR